MQDIDDSSEQLKSLHEQLKNKFIFLLENSGIIVDEKDKDSIIFEKIQNALLFSKYESILDLATTINVNMDLSLIKKIFKINKPLKNMHIKEVCITVNQKLDISCFSIIITFANDSVYKKHLKINIDSFLIPNYLSFIDIPNKTNMKSIKKLMQIDDEIFLFRFLYAIDEKVINQILPEIRMVGVYDYNSDDFQQRIKYCELLDY